MALIATSFRLSFLYKHDTIASNGHNTIAAVEIKLHDYDLRMLLFCSINF